ncbi:MAG: hypothetical protein Q9208_004351 [Pyrenodesmia sp. 3 TL-2023]
MDNTRNNNVLASESSRSAEVNDRPRRAAPTARRHEQHQRPRRSASPSRPRPLNNPANRRRRTPPSSPAQPPPPPTLRNPIKAAHTQILAFLTIRKAAASSSSSEAHEAHQLQLEAEPMIENMLRADFPAAVVAYCMIDQEEPDEVLGKMIVARLHEAGVVQALWGSGCFQGLFETKWGATRVARLLCSGYAR